MATQRQPLETIQVFADKRLKYWLPLVLNATKRGKEAIPVVDLWVVSSAKMKEIYHRAMGQNQVTDVLSFPSDPFYQGQGHWGQLVLCGPVVTKQATEVGHTWKKEVDVLLVHGLLHLRGFDHETSELSKKRMQRLESKLLAKALGLIERSRSVKI